MLLINALFILAHFWVLTQASSEVSKEYLKRFPQLLELIKPWEPSCLNSWIVKGVPLLYFCNSFSPCNSNSLEINSLQITWEDSNRIKYISSDLYENEIGEGHLKVISKSEDHTTFENSLIAINDEPEFILICPNDAYSQIITANNLLKHSGTGTSKKTIKLVKSISPIEDIKQNHNRDLILQSQSGKTTAINSYLEENVCTITQIFSWTMLAVVLVSLLNSMGVSEINGVFFFIGLLQSNNLLAYINFPFASNYICFYKSLDIFNFHIFLNIPNLIKSIFTSSGDSILQTNSEMFDAYGVSANWFDDGGKAITPLILMCIVLIIVKILLVLKCGTESFPLLLQQIEEKMVWNGFIRGVQITFLPLLLASLLQFDNISFDTVIDTLGFVFALAICIALVGFVLNSLRVLRSANLREKHSNSKFGAIYSEYWLDKEVDPLTVNFEIFILIKKTIQLVTVVYLDLYPIVQTIIFLSTECCQTILLYLKRRFKDKTMGKLVSIISTTNFINILVLCFIFLTEKDATISEGFEWAIIGFSAALYLVNIALIIGEQILVREEIYNFYRGIIYAIWLIVLAFFSFFCCVCILGYKAYWTRKARKNTNITTELVPV